MAGAQPGGSVVTREMGVESEVIEGVDGAGWVAEAGEAMSEVRWAEARGSPWS